MRPWLVLLLLSSGIAGCLGEAEPTPSLQAASEPEPTPVAVAFRCPDAEPCPETFLESAPYNVERSLRDPGRFVAAARSSSGLVTTAPSYGVLTTDDGITWDSLPLPELPVRPDEPEHNVYAVDAIEAPDGSLHALMAVSVSPGLVGTPDGTIPESRGYLAYTTAPDGKNWQPMVRLLEHTYLTGTRLHWLEGEVWATWHHDDPAGQEGRTALAPVSDVASLQTVPRACRTYDAATRDGSILLTCRAVSTVERGSGVFRLEPSERLRAERVETPCPLGRFVDDGDLWFVSACDAVHVSRYNGTAFEPYLEVPLDDVPSTEGDRTHATLRAATRDGTGTWHVVLEMNAINPGLSAVCRCTEAWTTYLAIGPDGAVAADAMVSDGRAKVVYRDQPHPYWFNAWAAPFGNETLLFRSGGSSAVGFWVDTTT